MHKRELRAKSVKLRKVCAKNQAPITVVTASLKVILVENHFIFIFIKNEFLIAKWKSGGKFIIKA